MQLGKLSKYKKCLDSVSLVFQVSYKLLEEFFSLINNSTFWRKKEKKSNILRVQRVIQYQIKLPTMSKKTEQKEKDLSVLFLEVCFLYFWKYAVSQFLAQISLNLKFWQPCFSPKSRIIFSGQKIKKKKKKRCIGYHPKSIKSEA